MAMFYKYYYNPTPERVWVSFPHPLIKPQRQIPPIDLTLIKSL